MLLEGSCERGKFPAPWEDPSLVGKSTGTEGSFGALEESAAAGAEGELHR